jgi:hypothetical protein
MGWIKVGSCSVVRYPALYRPRRWAHPNLNGRHKVRITPKGPAIKWGLTSRVLPQKKSNPTTIGHFNEEIPKCFMCRGKIDKKN